jgi:FixJ family two-component response regulator
MPGMDGLELQSRLSTDGWRIPIIFLTGYGEVPTTARAFKQGAVDFLEKPFHENALLEAIHRALELDRIERERHSKLRAFELFQNSLTPREREVLDHVVAGLTTKSIAADLGVSNQAIDAHRQRLFRKAGVDNVAALVRFVVSVRALQSGSEPGVQETPGAAQAD